MIDNGKSTLSVDEIIKAPIENIIRLANWIGVPINHLTDKPNSKYRIACAIVRWNKRNPQSKRD
jgi:hypothetical protein